MSSVRHLRRLSRKLAVAAAVLALAAIGSNARAQSRVTLPQPSPAALVGAQATGRVQADRTVRLAITLPLRNQEQLSTLLQRLYDPADALYRQYLTPQQFADAFGPTQQDYDAVAQHLQGQGLHVVATHPNRAVLDVEGPASAVEAAFGVHLNTYKANDGRSLFAADAAPSLPAPIAAKVSGVLGLDNLFQAHPNFVVKSRAPQGGKGGGVIGNGGGAGANGIGTGPLGGLAPSDIITAYLPNLATANNGVNPTGTGQTLGLLELDGYYASYIDAYTSYFGLPNPTLVNVNVDGGPGGVGGGEVEVALDIEMMAALAPKATIYVYQAPNSFAAIVDTYNKIATDNKAKSISTSWGLWETDLADHTTQNAEAIAFQEMAAQGQSMFAASGDYGAGDPYNTNVNSVQDPASQPFLAGVGGTTLSVATPGSNESYAGEVGWSGSGGGVSNYWTIPFYQPALNPWYNGGSWAARNVPDVSLNADPNTGYDIYSYDYGGWVTVGGTSAAAPLWAGFIGLVNQGRAPYKLGVVGFIPPVVNGIYTGSASNSFGAADFHDVTSGNNVYWGAAGGYYAGSGYDNVTGIGSFEGLDLFYQLVEANTGYAKPLPPANVVATPGDKDILVTWSKSLGATKYFVYENYTLVAVVTTNSIKRTGLTNGADYDYRIIAQNSAGNSDYSASSDAVPAVVSITSGPNAAPRSGTATITWTTNVLSNSTVVWGLSSGSLTHTVTSSTDVVNHSVALTGLPTTHGTTIYYKVSSKDDAAVTATSSVNSFHTP
jgi:kumamolisin